MKASSTPFFLKEVARLRKIATVKSMMKGKKIGF